MAVPTKEAVHTWNGEVAINDRRPLSPTNPYRFWCTGIDLRTMAEASLPADRIIGGYGSIPRTGGRGGANAIYEGMIQALNVDYLREATDELEAAFFDVDVERQMDITFHDDHPRTAEEFWFRGRGTVTVKDAPGPTLHTMPTPYQSSFVLAIQRSDPRIYETDAQTETIELGANGIELPWVLPVVIPSEDSDVTFDAGIVRTPVVVELFGPMTDPTLVDIGRNVLLDLALEVGGGESVVVDLREGTITASDGTDLRDALNWPESNWWRNENRDLARGVNVLRLFTQSASPPARGEISYYRAYP